MRRRVVWATTAHDDFLNIIGFIAQENPDAAGRVADRIDQAVAALGDFAAGRAGRVTGTYEKVVRGLPYILAYEIVRQPGAHEVVAILHVVHGARDWPPGQWPKTERPQEAP
ncbi:MAG: type II toxin-antitoxin system RelE/ParE family toxin [Acetobacteraceae bacterium]